MFEAIIPVIIENLVEIVTAAAITAIGVAGSWALSKLGQSKKLCTIAAATDEAITAAQITVGELQQTVVDDLKAAAADGKLTPEEIHTLGVALVDGAMAKMSTPACNVLNAAGVDVVALIKGAGEDWISQIKGIEKAE